jgi:biotin transport system substrate-specific component
VTPRALLPVALLAALTAVGAHLRIPFPYVPVTLQAAFVCLAGLLLGPWRGSASQIVYVTAGLVGFPVFARGGGLYYVFEPSFGYLLGFIAGAAVCGIVAGQSPRQSAGFGRCLLAAWAGMLTIYAVGVVILYLNLRYVAGADPGLGATLQLGLAPLPKDLLVGLLAAWVAVRLRPRLVSRPT